MQAPEGQLQAERVELDALQMRGHCGVLGQLLVGYPQGYPRDDQKAKQAVQGNDDQQGAGGPFQSFVHEASTIPAKSACVGLWHGLRVPTDGWLVLPRRA
ncbi:hypothetical protein D3C84_516510 [compost metagenome]